MELFEALVNMLAGLDLHDLSRLDTDSGHLEGVGSGESHRDGDVVGPPLVRDADGALQGELQELPAVTKPPLDQLGGEGPVVAQHGHHVPLDDVGVCVGESVEKAGQ